ncbi:hypothetical protein NDU88_001849 [Pleurodeles waltl]|uniref:Myb/SANT-like DNA-binding domain-containing protein n=1 Tax=Pleurodeles waltl TaxID=8319 RepID=A0AAV7V8Y3_PLEWA|nr:hypothetical protein NDU88_001849 [Pleurodeles waltl]
MAHVSGERDPAFTSEELDKLVDGVLPQYTLLYGPPDKQVSTHQKKDIRRAITKDVRTLGVHQRRSTHCRKKWEDLRRWSKKTVEAQLGMASQRGRGARRTMTPLMFLILAVAYPELDGRLRASQQPQGDSCNYKKKDCLAEKPLQRKTRRRQLPWLQKLTGLSPAFQRSCSSDAFQRDQRPRHPLRTAPASKRQETPEDSGPAPRKAATLFPAALKEPCKLPARSVRLATLHPATPTRLVAIPHLRRDPRTTLIL